MTGTEFVLWASLGLNVFLLGCVRRLARLRREAAGPADWTRRWQGVRLALRKEG
jgi:hypothetical protein